MAAKQNRVSNTGANTTFAEEGPHSVSLLCGDTAVCLPQWDSPQLQNTSHQVQ